MRVTGIICEYNPFHNGHKYHIEKTRLACNSDYIIGIMSGPFTQRGTPAITDKYSRTKMALLSGCDIVLELPVRFATSSAEGFAHGAVNILHATGITDGICFGTESGNLSDFGIAARIIDEEPSAYKGILTSSIKSGLSFPAARSRALLRFLKDSGISLSSDISLPNNILAIEYIRACNHTGMIAQTIKRSDGGYHNLSLSDTENGTGMCSASALRNAIFANTGNSRETDISMFIPYAESEYLSRPVSEHHFSMQLYSSIMGNFDCLSDYMDISHDLAARIRNSVIDFEDWTQFITLLKTKQYTYTRIQRALLHCMLNIKKYENNCQCYRAPYIRVLGFRKSSSALMKQLSLHASVPVITKPASVHSFSDIYGKTMLAEDIYASELYEKTRSYVYGSPCNYNEYTHGMVITEGE